MIRQGSFIWHKSLRRCNHLVAGKDQIPELTKLRIVVDTSPQIENLTNPSKKSEIAISKIRKKLASSEMNDDNEINKESLPPTLLYVRNLMDHYENHVVLTQMGSFYELYFEQATRYAPQLNISLTNRSFSCGKVPFAGFPTHQLSRHLKVLVNTYGHSVTIVDQFKKTTVADNETNRFYRRVTRIVTPGTFIDEAFENLQENTYLLNIEFPENSMNKLADPNLKLGLCWCDISTGEIFVQQVLLRDLISAVTRIKPKEILLNDHLSHYGLESGKWYSELVELKKYFIKYQKMPSRHRRIDSFFGLFTTGSSEKGNTHMKIQLQQFTQKEIAALRNTLIYISDHLPDFSMNFQLPERKITSTMMQIDSRTSAALEIHSSVRDNRTKGTLFSTIRKTVTPAGSRLLTQWLSGPSLDLREIKRRQKIVEFFKENHEIREKLSAMLSHVHDIPRILQKFSFGRGEALELIQLAQSLKTAADVKEFLSQELKRADKRVRKLLDSSLSELDFKRNLIDNVLVYLNEDELVKSRKEDDPEIEYETQIKPTSQPHEISQSNSWVVHPSYSEKLQKLHDEYRRMWSDKEKLQKVYQDFFVDELRVKKVVLKQKQNGDYAIHILGNTASLNSVSEYVAKPHSFNGFPFHILQRSAQTRWISHKVWTDFGYGIEVALFKIRKEEANILDQFKERFLEKSQEIREIAEKLGYLDVLLSFGNLADEKNLVCPKIDDSRKLEIIGGRHLMVAEGISGNSLEKFTENDCQLENGNLWIITGPNMGGKSTFLRQNAINVILAQMGCFVPCYSAHIGLVDKIFSRVGSADDLYNEMSTFMVEMIETSFILHGATDRSLAILDEIGRGTSGKEGVSIAFATLRYLIEHNKCRSLFATHFGKELEEIISFKGCEAIKSKIKYFKSGTIGTSDTEFYYDYKLKPGICSKSDAIKVAKTAGFPEQALKTARELLL